MFSSKEVTLSKTSCVSCGLSPEQGTACGVNTPAIHDLNVEGPSFPLFGPCLRGMRKDIRARTRNVKITGHSARECDVQVRTDEHETDQVAASKSDQLELVKTPLSLLSASADKTAGSVGHHIKQHPASRELRKYFQQGNIEVYQASASTCREVSTWMGRYHGFRYRLERRENTVNSSKRQDPSRVHHWRPPYTETPKVRGTSLTAETGHTAAPSYPGRLLSSCIADVWCRGRRCTRND